jgi:hypothetical protein
MADSRPYGYGYPSYIGSAFQANCYDTMKFTEQLFAATARQNAAHEKRMAESRAANQPVYDAPPSPRPGSFSEDTQYKAQSKVWEARQAEATRWFEELKEELAEKQAEETRRREASEKASAEARAARRSDFFNEPPPSGYRSLTHPYSTSRSDDGGLWAFPCGLLLLLGGILLCSAL